MSAAISSAGRPQASASRSCRRRSWRACSAARVSSSRPGMPCGDRGSQRCTRRVRPGDPPVGHREDGHGRSAERAQAVACTGAPIRSSASTRVSAASRSALTPDSRRRDRGVARWRRAGRAAATARFTASSSSSPASGDHPLVEQPLGEPVRSPTTTTRRPTPRPGAAGRGSGSHGVRGGTAARAGRGQRRPVGGRGAGRAHRRLLGRSDLPVHGAAQRGRVALQRGQPRVQLAALQAGDGRLRRAHARGDLGLAELALPAGLDQLLDQLAPAAREVLQAREQRPARRRHTGNGIPAPL